MRVVKAITTAADAKALALTADRPRPTIFEVCDRVAAYADRGLVQVGYPNRLPSTTVEQLRFRGFDVIEHPHGTLIDWSEGRGHGPVPAGDSNEERKSIGELAGKA